MPANKTDYSNLSDQQLQDLLKNSDHAAFAEIYNRYFKLICVFIFKRLGDGDDTKDVVQELFTHLWIKRETLIITGSVSSYIYTAARNKMLDFRRRNDIQKKYIQEMGVIEAHQIMTDHLVREKQLAALIEKEIDQLPNRIRTVFTMSRNENMSYKEISAQLDINPESVKMYAKHAIKRLRIRLKELGI